ncbi:MAG: aldose epimerase family protein [Alistipes sp.]
MRKSLFVLSVLLFTACTHPTLPLMDKANFTTTVDGHEVSLYTLHGGNLTLQVTNYGARVVSLWTPDREGTYEDVVLGYDHIDRYVNNTGERFLGATVGRYANRIAGGKFELDGAQYTLPQNNNGQTLHGGLCGIDRVVWSVDEVTADKIVLTYTVPDGQDGFPGNLSICMTYALTADNEFRVTYTATTDAPTVVNLSHHSFFNLKGEGKGTILDNELTICGSHTTPVDSVLIPTGEIASVEGTPFDFRRPCAIGARIGEPNEQLQHGRGYDHNWVIDRPNDGSIQQAAVLYEPHSGRCMEVWSDQPALQFYSGNFFDGTTTGKYGRPLAFRESVALETQKYPDSPHHADFPSTVLRPGETYQQTCIYKFYTKKLNSNSL